MADQLDVAEVAGGQRVGFAAAEEGEALDRPGADFRDRRGGGRRTPARRCRSGRGRPRSPACGAPPSGRRRGPSTAVRRARGRRSAPPAGRRGAPPSPRRAARPSGRRCGARSSRRGSPRSAARRPRRRAPPRARSGGAGRKSGMRRMIGPTSGSRRKRWWKAPMSSSTPSAKRIRSIAVASSARPAGRSSSQAAGTVSRAGSTASARKSTRPGPGCQARTRTGAAVDAEQPGGDPTVDPQGAVGRAAAEPERRGRPDLDLERAGAAHGANGRAGGRRPGRSGWRSPCRPGGDAGSAGARPLAARADRGRRRGRRRRWRRRPGPRRADGDRGGLHLAAQDRGLGLGRRLGKPADRVDGVLGGGVFLGDDLPVKVVVAHRTQSSEGSGRLPPARPRTPQTAGSPAVPPAPYLDLTR